ncbi:MAG: FkbM family methyltransferase [Pseudomonadota bacterium]
MIRGEVMYGFLERVFGREKLWRVGRWLYTGARREINLSHEANGEYALQKRLAAHYASRGGHVPVIVDVGANLGAWARPFGEALAEAGIADARLVAFEPGPGQRERLEVNLAGTPGFSDVSILHYAIGAENGTGDFALTGEATGSSGLVTETGDAPQGDAVEIVQVEIRTLDGLLDELGLDQIDYVKVDTEGNDPNVLFGAIETLRAGRIGAIQFEYNFLWLNTRFALMQIFQFAEALDYKIGKIVPEGIEIYEDWHFELDRYVLANFVLIRNDMIEAMGGTAFRFDGQNVAVPVNG